MHIYFCHKIADYKHILFILDEYIAGIMHGITVLNWKYIYFKKLPVCSHIKCILISVGLFKNAHNYENLLGISYV